MVNIREKVFLISGSDFSQRRQAAESIKRRILKGEPSSLNILTLYSKEISIKDLREKVFTVSFSKKKVIIFKNFPDLPLLVRKFLINNLQRIISSAYLIFETDRSYFQLQKDKRFIADKFFLFILNRAAVFKVITSGKKVSLDDFIAGIRKNDLNASLFVLESLFAGGSKDRLLGPQIIGILVRKFSYLRDPKAKTKCLNYLWEADRAIKEKGLSARLVIETLLVKLFSSAAA